MIGLGTVTVRSWVLCCCVAVVHLTLEAMGVLEGSEAEKSHDGFLLKTISVAVMDLG